MKRSLKFSLITLLLSSAMAHASDLTSTNLPDHLDCRLTSVSPKGNGSSFRKQIQIIKQEYDPSKSFRDQTDYVLMPNQLGLDIREMTDEVLTLGFFSTRFQISQEQDFVRLKVIEGRGGGTGYGTPGFTVTMNYRCNE